MHIQELGDPDEDTFRILISTDNHLGYNERDPVRGLDSFAALEEVLYLAKKYNVRMTRCECICMYVFVVVLNGVTRKDVLKYERERRTHFLVSRIFPQSDFVLLAGDLFHDNKPSRKTLHKTMEIFKRYTMGPNPVQIQILSENNFAHGEANYLQEFYSVGEFELLLCVMCYVLCVDYASMSYLYA
jgi:double-strand break repair protein MRE11